MEKFGYSQARTAKLLNKSPSYISQILGLERLAQPAKEFLQTSEVRKEVQICASKEKNPERQLAILKETSEHNKTVKQIREEAKTAKSGSTNEARSGSIGRKFGETTTNKTLSKWTWQSDDKTFAITIHFAEGQRDDEIVHAAKAALGKTYRHVTELAQKTSKPVSTMKAEH